MTTHLTQEQITQVLLGEASEPTQGHLLVCETCRAEVGRSENDLALFGRAVRDWSEAMEQAPARIRASRRKPHFQFAMAGLATAFALLVFALVGTGYLHRTSPMPAPSVEDAALLTQMDAELARTVPTSMEPLTRLVAVEQPVETRQ